MLAKKINQGKALLAWHLLVQKKNNEQPLIERKRKFADGTEQLYYTRTKLIPGNVEATGERLIKEYIRAYEFQLQHGFEPEHEQDLPSLFTNSAKMADKRTCSDRTIRNHISRLRKVGLISGYVFHGSFHDYELWINPEVLFSGEILCKKNATETPKTAEISPSASPNDNNLPHNVAFETLETVEKENTHVDKCGVAAQQGALPDGEGDCHTLGTQETGNPGAQRAGSRLKSRLYGSVEAKKQDTGTGGAARAEKDAQRAVFVAYVEHFWLTAWKLIYPNAQFNDYMQRQAKNAIWRGVYGGFTAKMNSKEWEQYHKEAIERLTLAANYFENHPDKYAPMPYAEFKPGTGYFDFENLRGFRATEEWLIKQQVWRQQQEVNAALSRAQREISLHKQGKLEKLPKRLQAKTKLELFRFHENKMKRLGRAALDKFYAIHAIN
ncbi:hypothetical protein [Pontibacter mangrovi]|uniref:Uncharacterized protein n=1 Tax=Pontibacter mangrovi TaxID=2589816 RepID=A0A501W2W1_9BACT|nr:hypothetical protein [Pontibacter mangrovi]TPE43949.1 hypothetical protein FJM65_11025 [Pontibacter mangrovi]